MTLRNLLFMGSLLVACGAASAQTGNVLPQTVSFNADSCQSDEKEELNWVISGLTDTFYYYSLNLQRLIVAGREECAAFEVMDVVHTLLPFGRDAETLQPQAGTAFVTIDDLPADILGPTVCGDEGLREKLLLCMYASSTNNSPSLNEEIDFFGIPIEVLVDTMVPDAPTIVSQQPGDTRFAFSLGNVDESRGDSYTFEVQLRRCDGETDAGTADATDDGGTAVVTVEAESICDATSDFTVQKFSSTSIVLTGLENDVDYELRVVTVDDFDNRSEPSAPLVFAAQAETTPLSVYDGTPNPLAFDPSDCSATGRPASVLVLLFASLLWLVPRRRRGRLPRGTASLVAIAAVLFAGSAEARPGQLTLSLKGGPYVPAIDTEKNSSGQPIYPIYGCFFEGETLLPRGILPLLGADVDLHLWDGFGSVQLGVGASITQTTGIAGTVESTTSGRLGRRECLEPGDDKVYFTVLQLRPSLTYRADQLLDWEGVPLVPYARVGLVAAGYAFSQEGGLDLAGTGSGHKPLGVRLGYEGAIGMMLALDYIDLIGAWDLWNKGEFMPPRRRPGVVHSFLFVEAVGSQIDSFGQPGLILSPMDRLFETRLPFTFNAGIAVELP